MARKWVKGLIVGTFLIGGLSTGLVYFDRRGGTLDAIAARRVPGETSESANREIKPLELATVEVVTVKPTSMTERVRASGELKPIDRVVLRSKAAGTVTEVNARAGQRISAGEVLVRFAVEELTASLALQDSNLDGAQAELLRAEQTLDRVELLVRKSILPRDQLEKARSDATSARARVQGLSAQIDIARTALRNAKITAPFDGIVASRAVDPGTATASNAELMTVVDTSALEAEVLVSTRDISRLEAGQTAELQIDGREDGPLIGTVDRINPAANEGSRSVAVHVRLDNAERHLWGGMFATGSILVRERKDMFVLPATSLREDDRGAFVLTLHDGRLVRKAVTIRSRWRGGTEVEVGGVNAGDVVVASPLPEMKPGVAAVVAQAD
ncbi:efflux RND transporter periplasmic adaptor subunit [Pinisolibacter aquiterrae]|uniref:efflux RND transporter periplasmic adaptor subunit n=1 Tax=Pinisolibacter aquiterrae TaxID=2815579 RepID=UPI001C3E4B75|nr:efflux RND transporter periplasmic adaptor subunit [Pinisolibacter aquiterrae]MBV5266039.1 efflux RND transporter periplasmic adaptor subunit [Pinisolibacter aquiterrae]MCC8237104.1 efflux RND transporter periplasmic adaptor subunit [Pinisolibacter aquiterrae]